MSTSSCRAPTTRIVGSYFYLWITTTVLSLSCNPHEAFRPKNLMILVQKDFETADFTIKKSSQNARAKVHPKKLFGKTWFCSAQKLNNFSENQDAFCTVFGTTTSPLLRWHFFVRKSIFCGNWSFISTFVTPGFAHSHPLYLSHFTWDLPIFRHKMTF